MARIFNKSERKAKLREDHKAWLNTIARTDGRSLTAIARDAGLDPSALTRFMQDEERGSTLDTLTIAAVMDETGAPAPFEQAVQQVARRGLGEAESEPYEPSPEETRMVAGNHEHLAWFVMKSRALEYEGYRIGDKLIVDLNRPAKAGDIVCAQFYNWAQPAATQTVFRIFEPPALVVSGPVEALQRRTRLIDGENVIVKGVLRMMVRALP